MARGLGPGGRGWCMRVERVERVEGEGQGRKQGPSLDEGGAGRELEVPGLAAWRMARGAWRVALGVRGKRALGVAGLGVSRAGLGRGWWWPGAGWARLGRCRACVALEVRGVGSGLVVRGPAGLGRGSGGAGTRFGRGWDAVRVRLGGGAGTRFGPGWDAVRGRGSGPAVRGPRARHEREMYVKWN